MNLTDLECNFFLLKMLHLNCEISVKIVNEEIYFQDEIIYLTQTKMARIELLQWSLDTAGQVTRCNSTED
jgi:hypothetical protein